MQDKQITPIEIESQLDTIDEAILKARLNITIWEANNALRISQIQLEISRKLTTAGEVKW